MFPPPADFPALRPRYTALACVAAGLCAPVAAADVVISQVYGAGGNSGAAYASDFVELFNRGSAPVSVAGWSVQYASATGTGHFASNNVAALPDLLLQPGQYLLVRLAGGTTGAALPAADATGGANMSGSSGKVALVSTAAGLACNGGSAPCSAAQLAQIVDLMGYGSANFFETAAAPGLGAAAAAVRAGDGCTDTDDNSADFAAAAPSPRNSASPLQPCGGAVNQPVVASCPAAFAVEAGTGGSTTLAARDADGRVVGAAFADPGAVPAGITLGTVVPADAAGSQATVPLQVSGTVGVGSYAVAVRFDNDDASQSALCPVDVAVTAPAAVVRIRDIQGRAHRSPLEGQAVSGVAGIVTAVKGNGFYLQDPAADADPATSEGIFVFTGIAPAVAVGDAVRVCGVVQEFRPGGGSGVNNLTTTEIGGSPSVTHVSANNPLPTPTAIGVERIVPGRVIDDDAVGDVEIGGSFDVATDGIDFWESLEGMRVRLHDAVAVGPTSGFGELPALAGGVGALRTPRGGIAIAADDFNPERISLDDEILGPMPPANVGDLLGSVTGVLDYSFGAFKLLVTEPVAVSDQRLAPEITALAGGAGRLTVASFNVENLDANDPAAKFEALAAQIVSNLRAPDILGLMEIQDDNGPVNDGVVSARATFDRLVAAIAAAGGPAYEYRAVDPVDDQDGGEPGGNIRQGFLFNPARVAFVDRPAAEHPSVTALAVTDGPDGPQLSHSPGRIDPRNAAFADSRKPLAGEFLFDGRRLFVIANHFNSKGGDPPLFGRFQPPQRPSEAQRAQQAAAVAGFVAQLLERDLGAAVVVLGDLNDFEFAPSLASLRTVGKLADLVRTLPPEERYTYVFEGNSQVLDHILASPSLAAVAEYDVVHVNAEFAAQQSDHDPEVARFTLGAALEDVTARFDITLSGLRYNRGPQTYSGTMNLTNRGPSIARPLQVVLEGLPAGVTLMNAGGTVGGAPYLTVPAGAAAGQTLKLSLVFPNPQRLPIRYSVRIHAGSF